MYIDKPFTHVKKKIQSCHAIGDTASPPPILSDVPTERKEVAADHGGDGVAVAEKGHGNKRQGIFSDTPDPFFA